MRPRRVNFNLWYLLVGVETRYSPLAEIGNGSVHNWACDDGKTPNFTQDFKELLHLNLTPKFLFNILYVCNHLTYLVSWLVGRDHR